MGQHAQAIREKHTARNVTLIVLAVLIVLLAIAAAFGMQLYKQAKSVKAHESQAISSLSAINDPAKLKDAAASQASIAQAQQQTAQAGGFHGVDQQSIPLKIDRLGGSKTA